MWVSNSKNWNNKISPMERFMVERIIQRCDYEENISNKHRTINGYVQLKELIKLAELTYKRERTVRTLKVVIEEAKSKYIHQNICNDFIINKYFIDLKNFISTYDENTLLLKAATADLTVLKKLEHTLKIFESQLEQEYYNLLKSEFQNFDFKSTDNFERKALLLTDLIDLLIPYLLFKGYSLSLISESLRKLLIKGSQISAKVILKQFCFTEKEYKFLICFEKKNEEVFDFIALTKANYNDVKLYNQTDLIERFLEKRGLETYEVLLKFSSKNLDPIAQIRTTYDLLLKSIVIQKDRPSLSPFNKYFEKCFWGNPGVGNRFNEIDIQFDPINVDARRSTFRSTLINTVNSNDNIGVTIIEDTPLQLPENDTLKKAMYYYNMALGSKSIENSLSLLWTSIEALLPYRVGGNDISSIQHILGKALSLGAFSRDIHSFAHRFIVSNKVNDNCLKGILTKPLKPCYSPEALFDWYNWIKNTGSDKESFDQIKECSNLLAFQYTKIGRPICEGNLDFLLKRLESSEQSIKFQLQRIYLHRNQIIHAGDLVNEYSNLWTHLEWYIGKLLAYSYYSSVIKNSGKSLESIFRELEADHNYLRSYLEKNKSKPIRESERILNILFKHSWLSY